MNPPASLPLRRTVERQINHRLARPKFTSGGRKAPTRDLFWHFPGYLGAGQGAWRTTPAGTIRSGDWKLLEFFEDAKIELSNLADDLSQKTNFAERNPAKAKELHDKLVAWRMDIKAPMPTPNKK